MLGGFTAVLAVALYAIVGGPGVGKTSIIEALQEKGEETSREVATDYILERMEGGSKEPWKEKDFQLAILNRTLNRENKALQKSLQMKKSRIFSDRAILDLYVYMDVRGQLNSEEYKKSDDIIKEVKVQQRYTAIFFVLPWGEGSKDYKRAENRHEEHDEAQKLTLKTFEVYSKLFPELIEVPGKLSSKERADFVLRKVEELESRAFSGAPLAVKEK